MDLSQLQKFKTKKCDKNHDMSLSNLELNCPYYHSRQDKRRTPFASSKTSLVYSKTYIQDFYSAQMASNMIEHLFHPDLYKTIPCKNRFSSNYQDEGKAVEDCKVKWCPYIHEGDNLSHLNALRGLPMSTPHVQERSIDIDKQVEEVKMLMKGDKNQIKAKYSAEISRFKQHLKIIAQKEQKVTAKSHKQIKLLQAPKFTLPKTQGNTAQHSWFTHYEYFYYGQVLPIIQDRHHQFKNYRDIIKNDITPIVMKYIAAFLNSDGGVLYIGIDDSSKVCGLELKQHQFDRFLVNIDGQSKNNLLPPLMPDKFTVRRIPVIYHRKGKELWIVEVKVTPSQKQKKSKNLTVYNKQAYIRMNASTHRLDAISLIQYMRHNQQKRVQKQSGSQMIQEVIRQLEQKGKTMNLQEWQSAKQKLSKLIEKADQSIQALRRKEQEKIDKAS